MIPDYHPHKKGINEIPSKQGDQENKSMLYISQKHPEVEITRLVSLVPLLRYVTPYSLDS